MKISLSGGTLFRQMLGYYSTAVLFPEDEKGLMSKNTYETFIEAIKKNKNSGIAVDPAIYVSFLNDHVMGFIPATEEGIRSLIISFVRQYSEHFMRCDALTQYKTIIETRAEALLKLNKEENNSLSNISKYNSTDVYDELQQYRLEEEILSYSNTIIYSNYLLEKDLIEVRDLMRDVHAFNKGLKSTLLEKTEETFKEMIDSAKEDYKNF